MDDMDIKIGQKVFLDGKEVGEIIASQTENRYMIKRYGSEWNIDLYLYLMMHENEDVVIK